MGPMVIEEYAPEMALALASTYNGAIRGLPHCYPVDVNEFSDAVAATVGGERSHDRLHSEILHVGSEDDSILGFVHSAIGEPKPKKSGEGKRGVIRFLWYEPGHRALGQELLKTAEEYLRGQGLTQVIAYHQDFRYPFHHLKHSYLSDRLGHIQALFAMNGYQRVMGEVFLDWPDFGPLDPPHIDIPLETTPRWKEGRGTRPDLEVKALLGEKEIGICECVSCGDFSRAEAAQNWIFTEWIHITEDYQGRGLGRYLLLTTLQEAFRKGYRHASISTDWKNPRAYLFYTNIGYHVVDWTYAYGRELK